MDENAAAMAMDREKLEQILRTAVKQGASDVHLKAGERVLLRINGELVPLNTPRLTPENTRGLYEAIRPALKSRVEADEVHELDFSFAAPGTGRFRVNCFRQRGTLALVLRVIPMRILDFKELHLPEVMEMLATERRGLVLVTGATGSGKSTTLAAIINRINTTRSAHIVTIEDPIEFLFTNERSSIVQREIGTDTETFAGALRSSLRQDPNVIMIGEMRDAETIDIALKAAETGHLVLSTAHTTDASKTIQRLVSAFTPSEQQMMRVRLSETLRAAVSMRLLPRADGAGLIPAVEVLMATPLIRECIRDETRGAEMLEHLAKGRMYGMQTFDQDLLRLLRARLISREAAIAAATSPTDLELRLRLGDEEEDEMTIIRHQLPEPAAQEAGASSPAEAPGALELDLPSAPPDRRKA